MPNYREGLFLETTSILDIPNIDPNLKEFLVKLVQSINKIEKAVNLKDTGIYSLTDFVCGKTFFPSNQVTTVAVVNPTDTQRQVYRKEFLLQLPDGLLMGDNTIAHGLDINNLSTWTMTDIYGTTNDITDFLYYPLPYVDYGVPANNISLWVDDTNIHVNSAIARPNFTLTYVTLEFLKQ